MAAGRYDAAFALAGRAKEEDGAGRLDAARGLYRQAADAFMAAAEQETDPRRRELVISNVGGFLQRIKEIRAAPAAPKGPAAAVAEPSAADALDSLDALGLALPSVPRKALGGGAAPATPEETRAAAAATHAEFARRAEERLAEAVELDKAGRGAEAAKAYREASLAFLDALEAEKEAGGNAAGDAEWADRTRMRVQEAIARAKALSGGGGAGAGAGPSGSSSAQALGTSGASVSASDLLTDAEKRVLFATSTVNGRRYVPFVRSDLQERFALPGRWEDPDGLLALSEKQRAAFSRWARPSELWERPVVIDAVSPFTIRQTIITDCSFVAAMSVSAFHEANLDKGPRRRRLVSSCIFPRDGSGRPAYNPSGKYMVVLTVNGVRRKVLVDDRLPVDAAGGLLCSFSSRPGELWVSLLEKAFLKVMGGYQFPGSNGGIDLHVLTGWIPERVGTQSEDFERDRTWARMRDASRHGDCLITTSTSDLGEAEAERLGLVPSHAYAVLRVEEVMGHRLLLLKNPWSRVRWTGPFSPGDTARWTPALRKALRYRADAARDHDNGIFFIDYDSLLKHFSAVYMNWNPALFKYRRVAHGAWPRARGPRVDSLNREYCPQYQLTVDVPARAASASVWILLSKHSTAKKEEEDEFITVHVYAHDPEQAVRPGLVYYPDDPVFRGTYINNPHFLARLDVPTGRTRLRVVVSQYEKIYDLSYTLHAYCTSPLAMERVPRPCTAREEARARGEWAEGTAGGSTNHPVTFFDNPQFRLRLPANARPKCVVLKVEAPREFSVNVMAFSGTEGRRVRRLGASTGVTKVADSGVYRQGFAVVETASLGEGVTDVVLLVSTFRPGRIGPFVLTAANGDVGSAPVLEALPPATDADA